MQPGHEYMDFFTRGLGQPAPVLVIPAQPFSEVYEDEVLEEEPLNALRMVWWIFLMAAWPKLMDFALLLRIGQISSSVNHMAAERPSGSKEPPCT